MRTMFLAAVATLSLLTGGAMAAETAPPQEVAGDWQGVVSVGDRSLPLVIHVNAAAVSGDSPVENRFGIPGKIEKVDGRYRVSFATGSAFEGALTKDGKLEGSYSKGEISVPLTLERKAADAKPAS